MSGTGESGLPPLAAYVHIPWCVRKCPYCDFNSHTYDSGLPEAEYIDALIASQELELPPVLCRELETIFFGGGTHRNSQHNRAEEEQKRRHHTTIAPHVNISPLLKEVAS